MTAIVLVVVASILGSAAVRVPAEVTQQAQTPYLFWKFTPLRADTGENGLAFELYGERSSVEFNLQFVIDEGNQLISIPSDFVSSIRLTVERQGHLVGSNVQWISAKLQTGNVDVPLTTNQAFALQPGELWTVKGQVQLAAQQRFIPGNYIAHVSLIQALEKVRIRDGKPWNVRGVSNGDITLRVIVPATAQQRAKAHVQDGDAASLAGDHIAAIKEFEAALRETPTDISLHGELGVAYLDAGRFREAAEHLELAIPALNGETRAPLFADLAYAYFRLGDLARARATLSKVMSSQEVAAQVERMRTR